MPRFAAPGAGQEVGRLVGAFLNAPAIRQQAESDQRRLNTKDQFLRSRLEGQNLKNTQLSGLLGAQDQAGEGIAALLRDQFGSTVSQAPSVAQGQLQAPQVQQQAAQLAPAPQQAAPQAPQGFQTPGIAPQLPQGAPSAAIGGIASQLTGAAPGVQQAQPQPQTEQATPDDVQQVAQAKAQGFTDEHLTNIANLLARQGNPAQAIKIMQSVALLQRGVQAGASDPTEGNRLVAASQGKTFERFSNQGGQLANLSTGELGAVTDIGRANIGLLGARAGAANAQAGASNALTRKRDAEAALGPSGTSLTVGPDGEVSFSQGRGVRPDAPREALDKTGQRKTLERIRKGQDLLTRLDRVSEDLSRDQLTFAGRARGAALGFMDKAGLDLGPEQVEFLSKKRRLNNGINQLFNVYRKEITGAAASAQELQFLKDSMLNADLGPVEFQAAYNQFRQILDEVLANDVDAAQQGVALQGDTGGTPDVQFEPQQQQSGGLLNDLSSAASQIFGGSGPAQQALPIVAPGPQVNPLGEQPVSPIRPAPQNNPQEQAAPQTRLVQNNQTGEMTRVQLSPDGQTWVPVQ